MQVTDEVLRRLYAVNAHVRAAVQRALEIENLPDGTGELHGEPALRAAYPAWYTQQVLEHMNRDPSQRYSLGGNSAGTNATGAGYRVAPNAAALDYSELESKILKDHAVRRQRAYEKNNRTYWSRFVQGVGNDKTVKADVIRGKASNHVIVDEVQVTPEASPVVVVQPQRRAGWRTFHCSEGCGLKFEVPTRDRHSPSGEGCPHCHEWLTPCDNRPDDTLQVNGSGNLVNIPPDVILEPVSKDWKVTMKNGSSIAVGPKPVYKEVPVVTPEIASNKIQEMIGSWRAGKSEVRFEPLTVNFTDLAKSVEETCREDILGGPYAPSHLYAPNVVASPEEMRIWKLPSKVERGGYELKSIEYTSEGAVSNLVLEVQVADDSGDTCVKCGTPTAQACPRCAGIVPICSNCPCPHH